MMMCGVRWQHLFIFVAVLSSTKSFMLVVPYESAASLSLTTPTTTSSRRRTQYTTNYFWSTLESAPSPSLSEPSSTSSLFNSDIHHDDDNDDGDAWLSNQKNNRLTDDKIQLRKLQKLQGKLLKNMRNVCKDYNMIEENDRIMICVSGGKDSATLLYLMRHLQKQLMVNFDIVAVHVDQKQPGYDGAPLVSWLRDDLDISYEIVEEDTYSVVVDKTSPGKSYCTVCSRLRRGILYTKAIELGCNKIMLGHHADDCLETLLLNMIHGGQTKAMPARYTSSRGKLAVLRPLITCSEAHIQEFAQLQGFPILPCNLCSNQSNLQRPQLKLLLGTLSSLNPNAKANMLRACQDIRPSHLLDQNLRQACGMDPITGEVEDENDEHESV